LKGRSLLVKNAVPLSIDAWRGLYFRFRWNSYKSPARLRSSSRRAHESDRLPEPIFTPHKEELGLTTSTSISKKRKNASAGSWPNAYAI